MFNLFCTATIPIRCISRTGLTFSNGEVKVHNASNDLLPDILFASFIGEATIFGSIKLTFSLRVTSLAEDPARSWNGVSPPPRTPVAPEALVPEVVLILVTTSVPAISIVCKVTDPVSQ